MGSQPDKGDDKDITNLLKKVCSPCGIWRTPAPHVAGRQGTQPSCLDGVSLYGANKGAVDRAQMWSSITHLQGEFGISRVVNSNKNHESARLQENLEG